MWFKIWKIWNGIFNLPTNIENGIAKMNFQNTILAKYKVLGYKISDHGFNYFLTIIVFLFTSRTMYPSNF